jgi:hypothetical protein
MAVAGGITFFVIVEPGFQTIFLFSATVRIIFASGIALRVAELVFPDLIFSVADPETFG